jgi:predicted RNA-binding Zn ribbon-like protein
MVSQRTIPAKRQDAPGELELVRAFINTRDLEQGSDALADSDGLGDWLRARRLVLPSTPVSPADRARAIEVREALRALARLNSGHQADPADPADPAGPDVADVANALNRLSSDADVRLRYQWDGTSLLAPRPGGGAQEALGRILAIVGTSALDGSWKRLKVCPAQDCLWAFYDRSRNRSGTWCQMAECGNRAKARNYRNRHKSSGA